MARLLVSDLMTAEVVTVRYDDDLVKTRDLMLGKHVRHLPVVDEDDELTGLISHRDLLRRGFIEQDQITPDMEQQRLERAQVWELMVCPVETVGPETDLVEAAQIMLENKVGCLPVVEGRHLVGILTESDFVRYQMRS